VIFFLFVTKMWSRWVKLKALKPLDTIHDDGSIKIWDVRAIIEA